MLTQPADSFLKGKRFSPLLTHAHADHLIGFPMFPPLFCEDVQCDVYLKTRNGLSAREQVERLISPPLWPIDTSGMKAKLFFYDVLEIFMLGGVRVDPM